MRVQFRSAAACSITGLAMLAGLLTLQDQNIGVGDDEPAAAAVDDDSGEGESRRLPTYYGRLALSDEQREAALDIQSRYAEQIDALLVQIEELRTARDTEMEEVLTPGQKLRLQELREEARREAEREAAEADAAASPETGSGNR